MATSGSTDFSLNGGEIVTAALRKLRVLGEGEVATAGQMTTGLQALNVMIKGWQGRYVHLWQRTEGTLTLTADQQSYTFGSGGDFGVRALRIEDVRAVVSSTEIPMCRMSRDEYFGLPLKSSNGTPTQFYYDPQITTGKLYIWPVPSGSSTSLKFTYVRQFEDFDAETNDPDFPQEWLQPAIYNLAVELAPEYKPEIPSSVAALAIQHLDTMEGFDTEQASVRFVP